LARHHAGLPEVGRDPPVSVRLAAGSVPACWEEAELRVDWGGPSPYHDSFTCSF
jgi:hypothetical protein